MRLKLLACVAALAVAAAAAPAANAVELKYTGVSTRDSLGNFGPLPLTQADLTFTLGPQLTSDAFLITGVSGEVNGDIITGLAPLSAPPSPFPSPPFFTSCQGRCIVDNVFYYPPALRSLDPYGVAFESATTEYVLDYWVPGGYWEMASLSRSDAFNTNGVLPSDFSYSRGIATVPEPGTWALLIAGVGMIGVALRRRRAEVAAGGLSLA
jgi:hypothetical protein